MMIRQAEQGSNLADWIGQNKIVILQFGTFFCGPCSAIRGKLEEWVRQHEKVDFLYVPVENFPEISAGESVFTVPTILVYVEGRLTIRESGCFSLIEVLSKVERYLMMI